MERDRPRGFVLAAEEFEYGVWELAVPVRDPSGGILAALSILGTRSDLEGAAPELAPLLHSAAHRLGSGT